MAGGGNNDDDDDYFPDAIHFTRRIVLHARLGKAMLDSASNLCSFL